MSVETNAASSRKTLTLAIQGVAPRDELLLKSLVKLLSHRTVHNWAFGTESVNLRIVGDHPMPPAPVNTSNLTSEILWVGHSDQYREPFLHLPAHANDMEKLLNTLGRKILDALTAAKTAVTPAMSLLHDETFTLMKWPPAALVSTPARIKLATLMTGQPMSVDKLVMRSGSNPQECERFCQELGRAGILKRQGTQPQLLSPGMNQPIEYKKAFEDSCPGSLKDKPDSSLLSRIRRRLGLHA